ncbi:MAG: hypothetical protein PVJ63_06575 [Thioalkalispiraceae bacterium]|jgi:hypothetical protein
MKGTIATLTRTLRLISLLVLLSLVFTPLVNAGPLRPAPGEFTMVMTGVDTGTGELIFEGWKTGALPGHLTARAALIKQTGVALHLATRWTLVTPWGEQIDGENTAILNPKSLHIQEHGVIVDATGDLAERIGNFVVIHGTVSDTYFLPGTTSVTARVTYVPSQAVQ